MKHRFLVCTALVVLFALSSALLPNTRSAYAATGPIYWGALVHGAPSDLGRWTAFETAVQKKLSILHMATSGTWGTGNALQEGSPSTATVNGQFTPFPTSSFEAVRARGSIPLYTWQAMNRKSTTLPDFQSQDIVDGRYDDYIRYWARAARAWGHPFFLRFNHEMNGNWYPWSDQVNGNQPGDYVRAWRHVHDIFTREGATNVTWVWCVNVEYWTNPKSSDLESVYPGDAYVDWVGVDGYNWGRNPAQPDKWRPFREVMKQTYDHLQRFVAHKPIMVVETASSEYYSDTVTSGYKGPWITDAYTQQIPNTFPRMKAVVWYHRPDTGMDWNIDTTAASETAFRTSIASPYYVSTRFADLQGAPIKPLGDTTMASRPFVPAPDTGNLLTNGSFESTGSAWSLPWNFWVNTAAGAQATIARDTTARTEGSASLKANIGQTGGNAANVRLKHQHLLLQPNQQYTLSFWARASASRSIQVTVGRDAATTPTYLNTTTALGTVWRQYTYTFTAPAYDHNTALTINLGSATGMVWLDDVRLMDTARIQNNLIQNPSFETTGTAWRSPWGFDVKTGAAASIRQDTATRASGSASAQVTVTTPSTTAWNVQLKQSGFPLTANAAYSVTFWAKASNARTIQVTVQQGSSPWTEFTRRSITISTEWKQYSLTFTPTTSSSSAMLGFNLAQTGGQVWLDTVALGTN